jgi:hypothetical protein
MKSELIRIVTDIKKNKFYASFKKEDNTYYQLEMKKKKLNLLQKDLLIIGTPVKLDFKDHKMYFLKAIQWI